MIRHAKAGWGGFTLSDFERPLEISGMKDAEKMAIRLKVRHLKIEMFISSTALRARTTAEIISENYFNQKVAVNYYDNLYHASPEVIASRVASLENQWNTVAIVCHNPGITEFVNMLVKQVKIDDMPTCGIFAVSAACDQWENWDAANKTFLFFDYPRLR